MKFTRTAEAAANDRWARWTLIEAIADDAVESNVAIDGPESYVLTRQAVDEAGAELADSTVKSLCIVADFDRRSAAPERTVWRRYGWTTVYEFARGDWSTADAAEFLGAEKRTTSEIRAVTRAPRFGSKTGGGTVPFDDRCRSWVNQMNKLLMDGARLADEADRPTVTAGGHAALMLAIYHRIVERQLDAEIRSLLETETVQ